MLERSTAPGGVVVYVSPALRKAGVPHAFSTRLGGISKAPFDSMNLGNPNGCEVQDDYANIWSNYDRLLAAAGCAARELVRVHQVHGPAVARVRRGEPFDVSTKADALVGDDPRRALSVRVADCVPVLMATEDGRAVAAVHAGWRGVVAGVVTAAVEELRTIYRANAGSRGVRLLAAVGPGIGPGAFEVGPEVVAEFRRAFAPEAPVRETPDGKGRVDLREAIRRQLTESGIDEKAIDLTDRCTFRDASEFFSHRRETGVTGRMAAVISPKGD
jgi:polyphenol oxidase